MSGSIDHTAHYLRERGPYKEWCGGTKPPTRVDVAAELGEAFVRIYPGGSNPHGSLLEAVAPPMEFHFAEGSNLGPEEISGVALSAIESHALRP
jgi:hypothetical protein